MKPLHKSIILWCAFAASVLATVQQQANLFDPLTAGVIGALLAGTIAARQWVDEPGNAGLRASAVLFSVPLWSQAGLAVVTALVQYGAIDKGLGAALTTALAVAPVVSRGNDALHVQPPAKPRKRRGAMIGQLLCLVFLLGGCMRWPDACHRDGRRMVCDCATGQIRALPVPGQPRPAGRVVQTCNGQALPVQWRAKDLQVGP